MTTEKFCLKWNDFQENIAKSFHSLRDDQTFSDVTLVCGKDTQIQTHRVILSACSPFFESVLKKNMHSQPMIYMRGLKSKDLMAIVDFIYHGEANVYQEDLNDFLALAEELQLKGLTGSKEEQIEEKKENPTNKELSKPKKQAISKQESPQYNYEQTENFVQESYFSKDSISEDNSIIAVESSKMIVRVDSNIEDLKTKIETLMENINDGERNKWRCKVCGKIALLKNDVRRHVESHIEGVSHPCNLCGKVSRSNSALKVHVSAYHRK